MNEVYLPLPNLPPPMYNTSVPGYPRMANWQATPKLHGQVPTSIPQNTEEFDAWSQMAHTSGNYPMFEQMCEFMHFVNDMPPGAQTPLMIYALAHWRLPSWLPAERQLVHSLHQINDPHHLEQHHSWTLLKHGCSLCTNTYTSGNTTLVPFSMNGGFHSLMSGDNSCSVNKFLLGLPLKSNPPSTFTLWRY
jgi:hypothetical protein